MAVIVKRYRVWYNGVVYGPGQSGGTVIQGLSEEEEVRLIKGSGGHIEKYAPPMPVQVEAPKGENVGAGSVDDTGTGEPIVPEGTPRSSETETETETGLDESPQNPNSPPGSEDEGLLNINLDDLIKPGESGGE